MAATCSLQTLESVRSDEVQAWTLDGEASDGRFIVTWQGFALRITTGTYVSGSILIGSDQLPQIAGTWTGDAPKGDWFLGPVQAGALIYRLSGFTVTESETTGWFIGTESWAPTKFSWPANYPCEGMAHLLREGRMASIDLEFRTVRGVKTLSEIAVVANAERHSFYPGPDRGCGLSAPAPHDVFKTIQKYDGICVWGGASDYDVLVSMYGPELIDSLVVFDLQRIHFEHSQSTEMGFSKVYAAYEGRHTATGDAHSLQCMVMKLAGGRPPPPLFFESKPAVPVLGDITVWVNEANRLDFTLTVVSTTITAAVVTNLRGPVPGQFFRDWSLGPGKHLTSRNGARSIALFDDLAPGDTGNGPGRWRRGPDGWYEEAMLTATELVETDPDTTVRAVVSRAVPWVYPTDLGVIYVDNRLKGRMVVRMERGFHGGRTSVAVHSAVLAGGTIPIGYLGDQQQDAQGRRQAASGHGVVTSMQTKGPGMYEMATTMPQHSATWLFHPVGVWSAKYPSPLYYTTSTERPPGFVFLESFPNIYYNPLIPAPATSVEDARAKAAGGIVGSEHAGASALRESLAGAVLKTNKADTDRIAVPGRQVHKDYRGADGPFMLSQYWVRRDDEKRLKTQFAQSTRGLREYSYTKKNFTEKGSSKITSSNPSQSPLLARAAACLKDGLPDLLSKPLSRLEAYEVLMGSTPPFLPNVGDRKSSMTMALSGLSVVLVQIMGLPEGGSITYVGDHAARFFVVPVAFMVRDSGPFSMDVFENLIILRGYWPFVRDYYTRALEGVPFSRPYLEAMSRGTLPSAESVAAMSATSAINARIILKDGEAQNKPYIYPEHMKVGDPVTARSFAPTGGGCWAGKVESCKPSALGHGFEVVFTGDIPDSSKTSPARCHGDGLSMIRYWYATTATASNCLRLCSTWVNHEGTLTAGTETMYTTQLADYCTVMFAAISELTARIGDSAAGHLNPSRRVKETHSQAYGAILDIGGPTVPLSVACVPTPPVGPLRSLTPITAASVNDLPRAPGSATAASNPKEDWEAETKARSVPRETSKFTSEHLSECGLREVIREATLSANRNLASLARFLPAATIMNPGSGSASMEAPVGGGGGGVVDTLFMAQQILRGRRIFTPEDYDQLIADVTDGYTSGLVAEYRYERALFLISYHNEALGPSRAGQLTKMSGTWKPQTYSWRVLGLPSAMAKPPEHVYGRIVAMISSQMPGLQTLKGDRGAVRKAIPKAVRSFNLTLRELMPAIYDTEMSGAEKMQMYTLASRLVVGNDDATQATFFTSYDVMNMIADEIFASLDPRAFEIPGFDPEEVKNYARWGAWTAANPQAYAVCDRPFDVSLGANCLAGESDDPEVVSNPDGADSADDGFSTRSHLRVPEFSGLNPRDYPAVSSLTDLCDPRARDRRAEKAWGCMYPPDLVELLSDRSAAMRSGVNVQQLYGLQPIRESVLALEWTLTDPVVAELPPRQAAAAAESGLPPLGVSRGVEPRGPVPTAGKTGGGGGGPGNPPWTGGGSKLGPVPSTPLPPGGPGSFLGRTDPSVPDPGAHLKSGSTPHRIFPAPIGPPTIKPMVRTPKPISHVYGDFSILLRVSAVLDGVPPDVIRGFHQLVASMSLHGATNCQAETGWGKSTFLLWCFAVTMHAAAKLCVAERLVVSFARVETAYNSWKFLTSFLGGTTATAIAARAMGMQPDMFGVQAGSVPESQDPRSQGVRFFCATTHHACVLLERMDMKQGRKMTGKPLVIVDEPQLHFRESPGASAVLASGRVGLVFTSATPPINPYVRSLPCVMPRVTRTVITQTVGSVWEAWTLALQIHARRPIGTPSTFVAIVPTVGECHSIYSQFRTQGTPTYMLHGKAEHNLREAAEAQARSTAGLIALVATSSADAGTNILHADYIFDSGASRTSTIDPITLREIQLPVKTPPATRVQRAGRVARTLRVWEAGKPPERRGYVFEGAAGNLKNAPPQPAIISPDDVSRLRDAGLTVADLPVSPSPADWSVALREWGYFSAQPPRMGMSYRLSGQMYRLSTSGLPAGSIYTIAAFLCGIDGDFPHCCRNAFDPSQADHSITPVLDAALAVMRASPDPVMAYVTAMNAVGSIGTANITKLIGKAVRYLGIGPGGTRDPVSERAFLATAMPFDLTRVTALGREYLRGFCGEPPDPRKVGESFQIVVGGTHLFNDKWSGKYVLELEIPLDFDPDFAGIRAYMIRRADPIDQTRTLSRTGYPVLTSDYRGSIGITFGANPPLAFRSYPVGVGRTWARRFWASFFASFQIMAANVKHLTCQGTSQAASFNSPLLVLTRQVSCDVNVQGRIAMLLHRTRPSWGIWPDWMQSYLHSTTFIGSLEKQYGIDGALDVLRRIMVGERQIAGDDIALVGPELYVILQRLATTFLCIMLSIGKSLCVPMTGKWKRPAPDQGGGGGHRGQDDHRPGGGGGPPSVCDDGCPTIPFDWGDEEEEYVAVQNPSTVPRGGSLAVPRHPPTDQMGCASGVLGSFGGGTAEMYPVAVQFCTAVTLVIPQRTAVGHLNPGLWVCPGYTYGKQRTNTEGIRASNCCGVIAGSVLNDNRPNSTPNLLAPQQQCLAAMSGTLGRFDIIGGPAYLRNPGCPVVAWTSLLRSVTHESTLIGKELARLAVVEVEGHSGSKIPPPGLYGLLAFLYGKQTVEHHNTEILAAGLSPRDPSKLSRTIAAFSLLL